MKLRHIRPKLINVPSSLPTLSFPHWLNSKLMGQRAGGASAHLDCSQRYHRETLWAAERTIYPDTTASRPYQSAAEIRYL